MGLFLTEVGHRADFSNFDSFGFVSDRIQFGMPCLFGSRGSFTPPRPQKKETVRESFRVSSSKTFR